MLDFGKVRDVIIEVGSDDNFMAKNILVLADEKDIKKIYEILFAKIMEDGRLKELLVRYILRKHESTFVFNILGNCVCLSIKSNNHRQRGVRYSFIFYPTLYENLDILTYYYVLLRPSYKGERKSFYDFISRYEVDEWTNIRNVV